MGGKTKHAPRIKNNAKPSSSARTAELLGTAAPTFVGFSAHADLGIVPFAPGFASAEKMPDNFDANISPEIQLILRKLSKKDPLTKKKGLQELIELLKESNTETIKTILPLWPKYYQNLANDIDYCVRELSQIVLQLLVNSECKRAVAPYLKQLVATWIASQFDNYAPAASIAKTSFFETFASKRQEVCMHGQTEILEYAIRNLTFHTPDTLSTGKGLTTVESEQKYQRVLVCSLKELSFFIETINGVQDLSEVQSSLQTLTAHPKFWSFAKSKTPLIKAAWFELLYNILQSVQLRNVLTNQYSQLVVTSFNNIDETDPLVAPHVWGCILILQSNYDNWYTAINMKKTVLPKLSLLLRNGFNQNAEAVCPNLLPFFSEITEYSLQDMDLLEFQKKFFDDIKSCITCENNKPISKADYSAITKAYFECFRFLCQNTNNSAVTTEINDFVMKLIEENLIEPIDWLLSNEQANVKYFFQHTAALVAFWDRQNKDTDSIYSKMLNAFWASIFQFVTKYLNQQQNADGYLDHMLVLIQDLRVANPSLEDQKVKFCEESNTVAKATTSAEQTTSVKDVNAPTTTTTTPPTPTIAFIQKELKQLVMQLVKLYLNKIRDQKTSKYINHIQSLSKMYMDVDFYAGLTPANNLIATLDLFVSLIELLDDKAREICVSLIFEMIELLEKRDRFSFIENKLMQLKEHKIQILIMQRLLSYPLCIEPEVRAILSIEEARSFIMRIAESIISNNKTENFNILHKCFFQTECGAILIDCKLVDAILDIISQPLVKVEETCEIVDDCGSFIAQIMPVVCSTNNSSKEMQHKIFLRLFKFTVANTPTDNISEDTLWEITTCWQDALSSKDIVPDDTILEECADFVEQQVGVITLSLTALESISDAISKFVFCSLENMEISKYVKCDAELVPRNIAKIDKLLKCFFNSKIKTATTVRNVGEYCLYLDAIKTTVSVWVPFAFGSVKCPPLLPFFRRTIINFTTITKLLTEFENLLKERTLEDDATKVQDYKSFIKELLQRYSDLLLNEFVDCIIIARVGEGLYKRLPMLDVGTETLLLDLSESVRLLIGSESEIVPKIKDRLIQEAGEETNVNAARALQYLAHSVQYAQFEENATILLAEDLSDIFITQNKLKAYINSIQFLFRKLSPGAITLKSAIMSTEPKELWIKAVVYRFLILNNLDTKVTHMYNKPIMPLTLQFVSETAEQQLNQKDLLLYNCEIDKQPLENVLNTIEYINLVRDVLRLFPNQLTIKNWDAIRIGLSSWVLSISKSIDNYYDPKTSFFISAVIGLFTSFMSIIRMEKVKSSTSLLKNMIDEWESLFAREVNIVVFKTFYIICNFQIKSENVFCYEPMLQRIGPALQCLDYSYIYAYCKNSNKITLDNICNFLLKNLSSPLHCVRFGSVFIMEHLTPFFVIDDIETFNKTSDSLEEQHQPTKWHFLNRFEDYITRYDLLIQKYLKEFSFKLSEVNNLGQLSYLAALSFLQLWQCIIYACSHSPVSVRSIYTNWLHENKYEENFLHFLFRAMPLDLLRNHASKSLLSGDPFKELNLYRLQDPDLAVDRYACYLYVEVLRALPAMVRKWWSTSPSRQKNFIDNLTTNFVSPHICNMELKAIANKKEKHENMQVNVHMSTREVLAVYSIDEARMELVITLAPNYPLGSVKVECGKQIGGRSSSRNVGMQLTIFLTHQNGTIFDGLKLWKNNLDKKFEGVEECYVCYTVIHQDTCQLPKLTCKTCKKKFHGPCLYKWFTTSSKSTCPICRNVF